VTAVQAIIAYAIAAGMFVFPAVAAVTILRYGQVVGLTALGVVTVLAVAVLGPSAGLSLVLGFGGMGLALWFYGRRPIRIELYFAGLVATFVVGSLGAPVVAMLVTRTDPIETALGLYRQVGDAFDLYVQALRDNTGPENLAYIQRVIAARHTWVWTFFNLTPALLVAGATAMTLINFLLVRRVTPAMWGLSLNRWRAPDHAIWALLLPGLGLLPKFLGPLIGARWAPAESLFFILLNLALIALLPYVLQGLAVIAFFLERWRLPRFLRVLAYFLLLTQGLIAAVAALGLMEFWVDLRGRALRPKGENPTTGE
jgi:hypothetical protein